MTSAKWEWLTFFSAPYVTLHDTLVWELLTYLAGFYLLQVRSCKNYFNIATLLLQSGQV